jgi:hypothetical protein
LSTTDSEVNHMRNSTAYFAGVATVFAATALGFGGAMILTSATTPRSPTEQTKLERSVAAPAQASPAPDTKTTTTIEASATPQSQATPEQPPQSASPPSQPVHSAPTVPQTPASTLQSSPSPEQSATDLQEKASANAYARGSDEDIKKYIRKRERHWARRHYHDGGAATSEQVSNSADQNAGQSTTSSNSSLQPAAQEQVQSGQSKTPDQTAAKGDNADAGKAKRTHDRRWTRSYARDDNERVQAPDRQSLEVREIPPEEAPQPFFGMRRWRPFFDSGDDD